MPHTPEALEPALPERLVIAPELAARLDRDGHAMARLSAIDAETVEVLLTPSCRGEREDHR